MNYPTASSGYQTPNQKTLVASHGELNPERFKATPNESSNTVRGILPGSDLVSFQ